MAVSAKEGDTIDAGLVAELAANLLLGTGEQPADPAVSEDQGDSSRGADYHAGLEVSAGDPPTVLATVADFKRSTFTPFVLLWQGKEWEVTLD